MEDPLKVYSDILAIAYEEFDEDKVNRDSDGKFADKDGGDTQKTIYDDIDKGLDLPDLNHNKKQCRFRCN